MIVHSNSYRHMPQASSSVWLVLLLLILLLSGCGTPVWVKYSKLGHQALEENKPKEAERYYREALEAAHGEYKPGKEWAVNINLARFYQQEQRYEEAESHFQNAIRAQETKLARPNIVALPFSPYGRGMMSSHGEDQYQRLSTSLAELASLFVEQNKLDEAEDLYTRSLLIVERRLGKDHRDVVGLKWRLAETALYQENLDRSELLIRQSIFLAEELSLGEEKFVAQLNVLGVIFYRKGEFLSAKTIFRRALAIIEEQNWHERPIAMGVNRKLGDTLTLLGKEEEALEFLDRSEDIRRRLQEKELRKEEHEGEPAK